VIEIMIEFVGISGENMRQEKKQEEKTLGERLLPHGVLRYNCSSAVMTFQL